MVTQLEVDHAVVRFGEMMAVDEVCLTVQSGQVLAVLGPSGCGKSTLLRVVAGLEELSAGAVRFEGADLVGVPTHRRGFALMFQDGQLFDHLSVADNIAYGMRRKGLPGIEAEVARLLDLVGLAGYGQRRPGTLSGGEQQRVALARALAVRPRLLLLDEPLSALDRSLRERLSADLRAILVETGTTALLVTHDHDEAFAVADRMALMRRGRIVQEGETATVWRAPVDAEAARFLGYDTVLSGAAAGTVLAAGGLAVDGAVVALRRSGLRADPDGSLRAVVTRQAVGRDGIRLLVEVGGIGELPALAALGAEVREGDHLTLGVDPSGLAILSG